MYFVDPYYIEKAAEVIKNFYKTAKEKTMDKRDNITNIVIEGDGKKTVALVASDNNGRIIETVHADCAPEDVYNFNIGAKLALDRLYEGYDMTPKPKRKPYNGLIYIHHYPGCGLSDRSVYRVIDGKIKGCWYHSHPAADPYIFSDMTDEQLSRKIQIDLFGSYDLTAKVIAHFVDNDKT